MEMDSLDSIKQQLERYDGKKVAILYSGGLDSSLLTWFLIPFAKEIALVLTNPGPENSPYRSWYDPHKPIDYVNDFDQFNHYASILKKDYIPPKFIFKTWELRVPQLLATVVDATNLIPPNGGAIDVERESHFFSGFMAIRMIGALSIAAAQGYDHVLTGHLDFNSQYHDESESMKYGTNTYFREIYGYRLVKVPTIEMPWRDARVSTRDLIMFNEQLNVKLDYKDTISCSVSVLEKNEWRSFTRFKLCNDRQIHCGKCVHCLDRKKSFEKAGVVDNAYWA